VCGLLKRGHAGRATEAVRLYEDWEPRIIDERRRRGCDPKFPRTFAVPRAPAPPRRHARL